MPKYTPSEEDIYSTNLCFICGNYTDDDEATCSEWCRVEYDAFKDYLEADLLASLDRWEE